MEFCKHFDAEGGYTVDVRMEDEVRGLCCLPLRSFGERQGDAIAFQLYDCPKLTDLQLKSLIKNYDATHHYIRVVGRSGNVSFVYQR